MNFTIKKKNLFLIDDISPYHNFINARKTLNNMYKTSKKAEKNINLKIFPYKNIVHRNDIKPKKKVELKSFSIKLLKDQKFLISHFSRKIDESKNDYLYNNTNGLLKTLNRLNYLRYKNNDKKNMMTKYSYKNIYKTLPNANTKYVYNSVKKQKVKYENLNLPIIKHIFRKKKKLKILSENKA